MVSTRPREVKCAILNADPIPNTYAPEYRPTHRVSICKP